VTGTLKPTTPFNIIPILSMRGALHPFPHTSLPLGTLTQGIVIISHLMGVKHVFLLRKKINDKYFTL
jgi:hypothetical protein